MSINLLGGTGRSKQRSRIWSRIPYGAQAPARRRQPPGFPLSLSGGARVFGVAQTTPDGYRVRKPSRGARNSRRVWEGLLSSAHSLKSISANFLESRGNSGGRAGNDAKGRIDTSSLTRHFSNWTIPRHRSRYRRSRKIGIQGPNFPLDFNFLSLFTHFPCASQFSTAPHALATA